MSSSFDTMQYALAWLGERIAADDLQARDVLFYFREVADALHDHSHATGDAPNHAAGPEADLLRTALRHDNHEDRALWLAVKDSGRGKQ